jgi:dethiobiotin synthetase
VANRINPGLAHYAEIIDVLSKKLPAPLIGESRTLRRDSIYRHHVAEHV